MRERRRGRDRLRVLRRGVGLGLALVTVWGAVSYTHLTLPTKLEV